MGGGQHFLGTKKIIIIGTKKNSAEGGNFFDLKDSKIESKLMTKDYKETRFLTFHTL